MKLYPNILSNQKAEQARLNAGHVAAKKHTSNTSS